MSTILPDDLIPECDETFDPPTYREDLSYVVDDDASYRLVGISTRLSVQSVGPYLPGQVYLVTEAEAERLVSVKGLTSLPWGESVEYCPVGQYGSAASCVGRTTDDCEMRTGDGCLVRLDTILGAP